MPTRTSPNVNHRFIAYRSPPDTRSRVRVGLVDDKELHVAEVLGYTDLFELIATHPDLTASHKFKTGPVNELRNVEVLAPLPGRDVLCIGKNYTAHATEFHKSGFDSSDKNEQPEYPVIFTKRATSIIPNGHPVCTHPDVTSSVDYEGELGIIIGKPGLGIRKEQAWNFVWGAVIINDFTARERQRDHKQFFIGKSLDTFCPMGPYVIPASSLAFDELHLTTKVNGEVRQSQNTAELIFDIPTLIQTISLGISIQPGDVIATGTPAGVGMGMNPNVWLKDGDVVEVSIPPLGTLRNPISSKVPPVAHLPSPCAKKHLVATPDISYMCLKANSKTLHVEISGPRSGPAILFFHGLGSSLNFYHPIIDMTGVDKTHRVVLFDLEGHGRSPLSSSGSSGLSVDGFARDAKLLMDDMGVKTAHVVGHCLGGLIATTFCSIYPDAVDNLLLIGATKRLSDSSRQTLTSRAQTVRSYGMDHVAAQVVTDDIAVLTKSSKSVVKSYVKLSITSSQPEGYALACLALATAPEPSYSAITAKKTIILAGKEDKTSPLATAEFLHEQINGSELILLDNVGHWHGFEDVEGTAKALTAIL